MKPFRVFLEHPTYILIMSMSLSREGEQEYGVLPALVNLMQDSCIFIAIRMHGNKDKQILTCEHLMILITTK